MYHIKYQSGFSLIEMMIVVGIVSCILYFIQAFTLQMLTTQTKARKTDFSASEVLTMLQTIEKRMLRASKSSVKLENCASVKGVKYCRTLDFDYIDQVKGTYQSATIDTTCKNLTNPGITKRLDQYYSNKDPYKVICMPSPCARGSVPTVSVRFGSQVINMPPVSQAMPILANGFCVAQTSNVYQIDLFGYVLTPENKVNAIHRLKYFNMLSLYTGDGDSIFYNR